MEALIIIFLAITLLIGFIDIFSTFNSIKKSLEHFYSFRSKFIDLANEYGQNRTLNNETYYWLTKHSSEIQSELGGYGLMDYQRPFSGYMVKNYPFIINTLPQFRTGTVIEQDISALDDILVRYIGIIETSQKSSFAKLLNPFIWFRTGMEFILSIPIQILFWLGIIGSRSKGRLIYNSIFKIIAGIASLVTLVSGLTTIIIGQDQFINFINSIF